MSLARRGSAAAEAKWIREEGLTMKLSDFIVQDAIIPELGATDRNGAIRELVTSLGAAGAVPESAVEDLVAALIKREQNGSTGFGKGVAVPHVKHPLVKKMVGTIGRSAEGIDFAALDHQPVYSIVLLLSPENQPQQHLQAMNIVFSNLQKDMFRRFLRQADTREAIVDLLNEADQGK
ncbi:MAG TPA: PTS sugar transporter subunit IIA [Tepidisphaeraceae bacterium]|jgi:mannitol/fructose-specific phosphotransferase system IIA component (Ntr-type)|nr:PTS sugar transporter subunit IIA [Tepidisphaeraceae bacterium]